MRGPVATAVRFVCYKSNICDRVKNDFVVDRGRCKADLRTLKKAPKDGMLETGVDFPGVLRARAGWTWCLARGGTLLSMNWSVRYLQRCDRVGMGGRHSFLNFDAVTSCRFPPRIILRQRPLLSQRNGSNSVASSCQL